MKFKVGDKVIISKPENGKWWNEVREEMEGTQAVIVGKCGDDNLCWTLEIDGKTDLYWWSEDMLKCDHQWQYWGYDGNKCTQCGSIKTHLRNMKSDKILKDATYNYKETKMEKPKTKLEKQACKEARKEAVKEAIDSKKEAYKTEMSTFITLEQEARDKRKYANELREKLGVTDKEMEQLFE